MINRNLTASAALVLALTLAGSACSSDDDGSPDGSSTPSATAPSPAALPQGGEPYELDPDSFTAEITNPYWPMAVGSRWVYRESDRGTVQRVVVTVLDRTTTVAAGIEARVVRDVVTQNGQLVEDTFDWYAQDSAGNVWYVGESTTEFENGEPVSTAGSWEAGVDGALAGIIMPAQPTAGQSYRQEFLADEAEDQGAVVSLDEFVQTRVGRFDDVVMTRDTTPLEPDVAELKFYARDVGLVLVLQTSGGASREELVAVSP